MGTNAKKPHKAYTQQPETEFLLILLPKAYTFILFDII